MIVVATLGFMAGMVTARLIWPSWPDCWSWCEHGTITYTGPAPAACMDFSKVPPETNVEVRNIDCKLVKP